MIRFAAIFISPLLLLIGLLVFFYQRDGFYIWAAICLGIILITNRIMSRGNFWRHIILWLNLVLVFASEWFFLLLVTSAGLRTALAFLICISWGIQWWFLKKYFDNIGQTNSRDYLSFSRFFYYVGLWFLSTSLYSFILIVHFKLYWAALILAVALVLWGFDLIRTQVYAKLSVAVVAFLTLQVAAAAYLLPVSFWVSGSIVTAWYFFATDKLVNQEQNIKNYFLVFSVALSLLLITSII